MADIAEGLPVAPSRAPCFMHDDDSRACAECVAVLKLQVKIAHGYLKELADGVFNDFGVMQVPVQEPVQGQSFKQIAGTALRVMR